MLWMLDGKLVTDANGVPIDCSHCPCQVCGKLLQVGSYHIVMTVSGYESDTGSIDMPPDEVVTREEWENTVSSSATLQGTLPANGFIMSNTNRWLRVQSGSTVSGRVYNSYTMYYDGGHYTNWSLIEGDEIQPETSEGTILGEGWLIIHCNSADDDKPYLQVLFGYVTNCMYSDDSTQPTPYGDSINVIPNNYYASGAFNQGTVNLTTYGNGLIVTSATLSKDQDVINSYGYRHVIHNSVNVTLTYIPPPSINN